MKHAADAGCPPSVSDIIMWFPFLGTTKQNVNTASLLEELSSLFV